MSKADTLKPAQINKVLRTCDLMSHSECKKCVLVLSHSAMRITEIGLLEVRTILFANGKVKSEIHLPSKICKGLKPRTIWLSDKSRLIIQNWIDYRIKKKWGLMLHGDQYQSLNPKSKLIFNSRGKPYELQPKHRKLENGNRTYWACDSLEQAVRNIYKKCGLHNCSSHSGRKALCSNGVVRGVSLEQLARILGHREVSTTLKYIVIDEYRIKQMCAEDWI